MNNYLIPTNTKKGQLWFGFLRGIDVAVLLSGIAVTILLFLVVKSIRNLATALLILIPLLTSVTLVFPLPQHYHNVMQFLVNMCLFFTKRRRYYWKGWCVRNADEIK